MFARTPRLLLRPGWPEDAPALTAAIAHEAVVSKLARVPWPYTLARAEDWLGRQRACDDVALVILSHEGVRPALIGGIGLHPAETEGGDALEIGYWLTPAAWGRGYATEAGRAVVDMARLALGRQRLISRHFADNPASGRVLAKLGFRQTGTERLHSLARGHAAESLTFALDLMAQPAALAA